ncbi:MAG: glycosyltransferase family 4 protein [Proteobacteria bacterium]|nr:glycosyltransferase family 4 protein [Pseudomonadota bacterium]
MHLCFMDIAAAYDAQTPYTMGLGGTQAAVCYLSAALVKAGAQVTLVNQKREAGEALGVRQLTPEALDDDTLQSFSAIIVNGRWTEELVRHLKQRTPTPLWAWMHEACFQTPYILPLAEFAGFLFVSEWQRHLNAPLVPKPAKSPVISNGIAPPFHTLFLPNEKILSAKSAPTAVYAGSSKRGLLQLPEIIPALRAKHPDLLFEIYNDGVVGTDENENREFREKLLKLEGLSYLGAVSQAELAARLKRASYFLSPNTYPETFCIALAEAMAAGCFCIATARAALPSTAHGFAALMPVPMADDPSWQPDSLSAADFSAFATEQITQWQARPAEGREKHLRAQVDFARTHYDWGKHAAEWKKFLGC